MTSYSYDEEPKKYKAEISARDRKVAYLEELIEHEKAQHIKWQKLYFETKEELERTKDQLTKLLSQGHGLPTS